jgi:hypothetical protein
VSTLAIATRSYRPLVFRPPVERIVAIGLLMAAALLWLVVVPLEFALI